MKPRPAFAFALSVGLAVAGCKQVAQSATREGGEAAARKAGTLVDDPAARPLTRSLERPLPSAPVAAPEAEAEHGVLAEARRRLRDEPLEAVVEGGVDGLGKAIGADGDEARPQEAR